MKSQNIKYRQNYLVNPVTIAFTALAVALGVTLWSTGPALLVRIESNRVVKSTLSKFQRNRGRYLAHDDRLDQLYSEMLQQLRQAGVTDPEMEAWFEVDEAGKAHVGVSYKLAVAWPFSMREPSISSVKQEFSSEE